MVFGSRRQETLDLGFLLLDTHQRSVLVILRKLMLPDGFDSISPSFTVRDVTTGLMVVGRSRQETLDSGFVLLGTRQQCVPMILRELVLPGGSDAGPQIAQW
ncbi:unnamed protein product [Schistosoma margrebowiei]|uniref:Uncharacterized protein n=1 Tax=Schistosoma margrebowiei TaxID=48269 RepID=A0A183L8F2_9TREM|nr:unnamed protein product [Schistosoma margrebowiei]